MKSIWDKEETYLKQIAPIREITYRFAAEHDWTTCNRGRTAHAGICGSIGQMQGVIDVMLERIDWDLMPDHLARDTIMTLWSSATLTRDGTRCFADHELFWHCPFGELEQHVQTFLDTAWNMLLAFQPADFYPSRGEKVPSPHLPPHFGPPQRRRG